MLKEPTRRKDVSMLTMADGCIWHKAN